MQHLFITSADSQNLFPDNNGNKFTVELPTFLKGVKYVALLEFYCDSFFEPLFLFCDIVKSSYAVNSMLPILRVVNTVGEVGNVMPVKTTRDDIIRITFTITDLNLQVPAHDLGAVRLVLRVVQ